LQGRRKDDEVFTELQEEQDRDAKLAQRLREELSELVANPLESLGEGPRRVPAEPSPEPPQDARSEEEPPDESVER
jgi:hypothetical protein